MADDYTRHQPVDLAGLLIPAGGAQLRRYRPHASEP